MSDHDRLVRDLAELGRSLPTPTAPGLENAVMVRLNEPETPSSGGTARSARIRVRAVAIGLAVMVALLAVPPVRAAVADWFGFGAVVVRTGDGDGNSSEPSATPPSISPGLPLVRAAAQVEFDVFELPALGEPAAAEVSADGRVLSLSWDRGLRLDQLSSLSRALTKSAETVESVSVNGREALWFDNSHQVVLLDEAGTRVPETERPAGRTLLWTVGDTTLRLEGDLGLARALAIAESAERLG